VRVNIRLVLVTPLRTVSAPSCVVKSCEVVNNLYRLLNVRYLPPVQWGGQGGQSPEAPSAGTSEFQAKNNNLTDLQILDCELHKNAFGGRAPPAPAKGAIALPQTPVAVTIEGEGVRGEEKAGNGERTGVKGWT